MEFTINVPYRKVKLTVSVEKPQGKRAATDLERLVRKQDLTHRATEDMRMNQDKFFLLK